MTKILSLFFSLILLSDISLYAATYYISPAGNDSNAGTENLPCETLMKAQQLVEPGDTVFIRGGVYKMNENQLSRRKRIWAVVNDLYKSGKPGKRIHYFAYPGEKPVFDLSDVKPANQRVMVFGVTGSWIHIRGLEVIGTQVTILTHTQSECFHNEGSNNIYEHLSMHDGQAIGFYLTNGSDNLILNCDAYRNYDFTSEGGRGGNVDGFGCHPQPGSKNNVFRGCRAWFNSDDGYDCIRAAETVIFENCWAFYNGFDPDFKKLGDGNGFKAGGWGLIKDERVPDSIPMHIIRFCVAVGNRANGFYANHQPGGNYWFNNTAWKNSTNFNMLNRNIEFTDDVSGYGHVLKNNLSFSPGNSDIQQINTQLCVVESNSFSIPLKITKDDFVSLDENLLVVARKPDGNLPETPFLRLKPGSKLIDAGVDAGFPFKNKAPDLGAFETSE
jgi:hypothetical protein